MVLACHERYAGREGYWLTRYEDVVCDPVASAREACRRFGLDEDRYPFHEIDSILVHGSSTMKQEGKLMGLVPKPKDFNPIGRWRAWPAGKKRTFKRIAGQALIDLGYCDDLAW
jgi:hypothetical protein